MSENLDPTAGPATGPADPSGPLSPGDRGRRQGPDAVRRRSFRLQRSAVLGMLLAALTLVFLVVASSFDVPVRQVDTVPDSVTLEQRTFGCDARLPGTTVSSGRAGDRIRRAEADEPVGTIERSGDLSRVVVAEQATDKRWLAWQQCPEPHAEWWFTGVGGSVSHGTVLTIGNPRSGSAIIYVDVFGPEGKVDAPGLAGVTIPGGTNQVFDLAKVAPQLGELTVRVRAERGLVTVSAADVFTPGTIGRSVREWLPPTTPPSRISVLTGLPSKPAGAVLLVTNPGEEAAVATLSVIGERGTFRPQAFKPVTVPAQSTISVGLPSGQKGLFDGTGSALVLRSDRRVTATVRVSDSGDIGYAPGVRSLGAQTATLLPDAEGRRLIFSTLNKPGRVVVTAYKLSGAPLKRWEIDLPARSSRVVKLPPQAVALSVGVARGQVFGGLSAAASKALVGAGLNPASGSVQVPAIRQGW